MNSPRKHQHGELTVDEYGEGKMHALYMPGLAASPWGPSQMAPQLDGRVLVVNHPENYGRVDREQGWFASQMAEIMNQHRPPLRILHSYAPHDTQTINKNLDYEPRGTVWLNPAISKPKLALHRRLQQTDFAQDGELSDLREYEHQLSILDGYLGQICESMPHQLYLKLLREHFKAYAKESNIKKLKQMFKRIYGGLKEHEPTALKDAEYATTEELLVIRGGMDPWNGPFDFEDTTECRTFEKFGHYCMVESPALIAREIRNWEIKHNLFDHETARDSQSRGVSAIV